MVLLADDPLRVEWPPATVERFSLMIASACPSEDALFQIAEGAEAASAQREHLKSCTRCQNRLERLRDIHEALRKPYLTTTSTESPIFVSADDPEEIDSYRIIKHLQSGGQADVYCALDTELLNEVAIKISKRRISRGTDNLKNEGQLLVQLDHPNLARVLRYGLHDERPYLVLEYVRGPDLARYAERGLSVARCAELVMKVARAVAKAHARGIVHQDIKPQNVVIDQAGEPKLLDFGVAVLKDAWTGDGPELISGTFAYMPPEQARGDTKRVGPASDIFSLGATLYALLTRRPPYSGRDGEDTRRLAVRGDFDRDVLDDPTVPRGLRDICLKAMEAEPEKRYGSAEDMATALERFVDAVKRQPKQEPASGKLFTVAVVVLAVAFVAVMFMMMTPRRPLQPQGELQVVRDLGLFDISRAGPLLDGDGFRFTVQDVSSNLQTAMFLVNEGGDIHPLTTEAKGGEQGVMVASKKVTISDEPSGRFLVLLLGSTGREPTVQDLKSLLQPWPWGNLKPSLNIYLEQGQIELRPRPREIFEDEWPLEKAQQFSENLKARFDLVLGWSFGYEGASAAGGRGSAGDSTRQDP